MDEVARQYVKEQNEWIKAVDLKHGDTVMVIVHPAPNMHPELFGAGAWPDDIFSVGQKLYIDTHHIPHDHRGLSVKRYEDADSRDMILGIPFYCVTKL